MYKDCLVKEDSFLQLYEKEKPKTICIKYKAMKIKKLLLVAFLFGATFSYSQEYLEMIDSGTFKVQEIIESAEAYFENRVKGRGTGYKPYKRWEYNALRLMNEDGYLPSVSERMSTLEAYNTYLNETAGNRGALNDNWEELGPIDWTATSGWNPGVGRLTSVAVDPTNSDIIIIGANTGGVWRTTDGGQNWTPLTDNFVNLRVFSVAIDPLVPTTYYFGSSSGLIFKSTDSGATFTELADISASLINKILIHPTNTDILFASSENAGTFGSRDGGVTWNQLTTDSRSYDIEFKPGDTSVVYASGRSYHRSTDGGITFTTITSAGFNTTGAKMMGVSPNDDSVVYLVQANANQFGGLFVSSDSGLTFTQLNHAGRNYFNLDVNAAGGGGQAPRDMDIAVSPSDVNEVHLGGGNTWRSLDGGVTFELSSFWFIPNVNALNVGYCHADIDILYFAGDVLFTGTDGGVFKAEDSDGPINTAYWEDLTTGIGAHQFYNIGVAQTTEQIITGSTQDNGTSVFTDALGWRNWLGADGGDSFVDKDNSNFLFGNLQNGNVWRSTSGGGNGFDVNDPPGPVNFITSLRQDPVTANIMFSLTNRVYRSSNFGTSWTPISQSFTGNPLDEIEIAPSNNQVMYVSEGPSLFRTDDAGATDWIQTTNPGGVINSIAIHPTDANRIAVATTSGGKVFVTEDGGQNWQNLRLNLPNFSALAVVWDDNNRNGLYVGLDFGVFYIDDTVTEWQPFSNLLPNVIISELEINYETDLIYAGTFGRGLWVSPLADELLNVTDAAFANSIILHPNPAFSEVTLSFENQLERAELRIFDLSGKLVYFETDQEMSRSKILDVSGLTSGVYFIRINSEEGTATKRLIKR